MATEAARLEGQIALILMKAGVPEPNVDYCIVWAFGPDAWETPPYHWPERWNKLHDGLPPMSDSDSFVQALYKVGQEFCRLAGL
jgi:hypothetical protein